MTESVVNLEDYRVEPMMLPTAKARGEPQRNGSARYLGGKVPMDWVERAGRLKGAALHMAIALAHQATLEGSETVKPPRELLRRLGVQRAREARALRALEAHGLVAVERHRGRRPRVTVLWRAA